MKHRIALAGTWTRLIMALCWMPSDWLPVQESKGGGFEIPHFDKVVHAAIFTVFGLLWLTAWPGRRPYLAVILAGIGLAGLTEWVQTLPLVGRDGEWLDAAVDAAGVLLAVPASLGLDRIGEAWQSAVPSDSFTEVQP